MIFLYDSEGKYFGKFYPDFKINWKLEHIFARDVTTQSQIVLDFTGNMGIGHTLNLYNQGRVLRRSDYLDY